MKALSWLENGLHFLTGLPEDRRREALVMPIQIFVDESGGEGSTKYFVMAGLVARAEAWLEFSDAWKAAMHSAPRIWRFKMSQACALNGPFGPTRERNYIKFTEQERDEKLKVLARVIDSHVESMVYHAINLDAHAKTWGLAPKPFNDPYFWPFFCVILSSCFDLWDAGVRERIEIVFDEQEISGRRAKIWYPIIREMLRQSHPREAAILPIDTQWGTDDLLMPLQAADMMVGCSRMSVSQDSRFDWIANYLPNLGDSARSKCFETEEEMRRFQNAQHIAVDPTTLAAVYAQVFGG